MDSRSVADAEGCDGVGGGVIAVAVKQVCTWCEVLEADLSILFMQPWKQKASMVAGVFARIERKICAHQACMNACPIINSTRIQNLG